MIKKYLPIISIFTIIIGVIALGIWYSDKNSPIKELAKLDVYSKEELSFLEEQGFLNALDSENLPDNKEQIISLLKSPTLIEQNLNSPDESFEVLATKLDENTYQLAFKLENKSNQSKEFYLIPISESSQTEFKEIKGRISGSITEAYNTSLAELYDVEEHKLELKPELAEAYIDIEHNNYQAKPIKITLGPNSTLLAQAKWEIDRDRASDRLEPVYFLVYGSAGGAKDELTILTVHSSPAKGENWEVEFTTKGTNDLRIIPNDQDTIDDDEFTGLYCDEQEKIPQILENDVIYYPNWQCDGIGKVVHYTKKAGNHTLKFQFGDQIAYAYNADDWLGISSSEYDSHCGDDGEHTPSAALDGTDCWNHLVEEVPHWLILDLGQTYTIKKVKGRSNEINDPTDVNIYVSDDKENWGVAVATGISTWEDTADWVEIDTTDKDGRYIKIEIVNTEGTDLRFGESTSPYMDIFDAYGDVANTAPTITSVTDYPDPIETGNIITFSVDWNDVDGEGIKMLICKTSNFTPGASPSCDDGQWCSNDNDYDSTDPITCTYTTTSSEVGSNDYYAFVCDNEPTCSSSTSGSFTVEAVSTPSLKFGGVSAGVGAAAWYHPKWLYRKKITIQNANVDGDLTDFPLYVDITSDADIGGNAQADGDDIRFTTDDGITVMPHEEESFTVSAGSATGHFWVKIPTVNNASTTDIYIYYGNSDAGDGQQVTAVWDSSFKMVQHMQEDPSGAAPQIIDSTDNNNDGTSEGSMTSGDQVSTGKVNGALDLDGSDDRINFGNDSTLNFNSMASYTLGYWISLDTVSPEFQTLLNKGWKVQFYVNYNDLRMVHNVGGGDVVRAVYPNMSTATWYRIVAVWNGTRIDFYVNGTKYVGGNIGTPDATSSNVLVGYTSAAYPRAVNGRIDEVRITNDVRTANEIKFEYYNMNEADNELDNFAAQETYSAPSFIRMKGGIIFK